MERFQRWFLHLILPPQASPGATELTLYGFWPVDGPFAELLRILEKHGATDWCRAFREFGTVLMGLANWIGEAREGATRLVVPRRACRHPADRRDVAFAGRDS